MQEKKMPKWEENRNLINDLNDKCDKLETLVRSLVEANSDLVKQIMQASQTSFRRPNLIRKQAKKLEQLVTDMVEKK